jgi:hypothetical protein
MTDKPGRSFAGRSGIAVFATGKLARKLVKGAMAAVKWRHIVLGSHSLTVRK